MLFSFRSADAAKYPRLLSVQTIAFALNERDAARMVKEGLATYDEETNSFNFTEFEKPRVTVIGSASAWPDVIGSEGFIDNPILVSERVLSDLQRERTTGFSPRPVEIVKRNTRKLSVSSAPKYFFLEVSGCIGMHVPGCVRANEVPLDLGQRLTAAWDGSDLFTDPPPGLRRWALFCSERVLDLARSKKWTNCGFQPLQFFAPFHKRYLAHESGLSLPQLVERYVANLK